MSMLNEEASAEASAAVTETLVTPPSCSSGVNPGAALFTAVARIGNNLAGGVWEYSIGAAQGQLGWAATNLPFDTGNVSFDLQIDPIPGGSRGTLSVAGGTPISTNANAFTQITAVGIRAEVVRSVGNPNVTLRAEWQGFNIDFVSDSETTYPYPGLATQVCPVPFTAATPTAPGAGMFFESRVILPGAVSGATYPYRMSLNGSIRLSSTDNSTALSAAQIAVKVLVFAS